MALRTLRGVDVCDGTREAQEPSTGAWSWNATSPWECPSGWAIGYAFNIDLGNFWPMTPGSGYQGTQGAVAAGGGRVWVWRPRTGAAEGRNPTGDARVAWAAGRVL